MDCTTTFREDGLRNEAHTHMLVAATTTTARKMLKKNNRDVHDEHPGSRFSRPSVTNQPCCCCSGPMLDVEERWALPAAAAAFELLEPK